MIDPVVVNGDVVVPVQEVDGVEEAVLVTIVVVPAVVELAVPAVEVVVFEAVAVVTDSVGEDADVVEAFVVVVDAPIVVVDALGVTVVDEAVESVVKVG